MRPRWGAVLVLGGAIVATGVGFGISALPSLPSGMPATNRPATQTNGPATNRYVSLIISPPCTARQLRHVGSRTGEITVTLSSNPIATNSPRTAIHVPLGTVLVVIVPRRDTTSLAVPTGCFVARQSRVSGGSVRAEFLMDKAGSTVIENVTPDEPGPTAQLTYLDITRYWTMFGSPSNGS